MLFWLLIDRVYILLSSHLDADCVLTISRTDFLLITDKDWLQIHIHHGQTVEEQFRVFVTFGSLFLFVRHELMSNDVSLSLCLSLAAWWRFFIVLFMFKFGFIVPFVFRLFKKPKNKLFFFFQVTMQHIVTWHQLRFSIRSRTYVPRMKFWFAAGIRSRKRKKSFSFSSESFTRLVFCFMAWNGILQCDLISLYVHIFDANGHKQIELNGTYISFSNKQILCTNLFNIVNVNIVYKAICVYIGFAITFLLLFLSVAAVLLLLFRFHLPVTFYLFIFYIFVLYSRLLYSVYILLLHEYTRICINTSGLCIQT